MSDVNIFDSLIEWVNSSDVLNPNARILILEQLKDARLKVQSVIVELQKIKLTTLANSIRMEDDLRRMMQNNFPYMDAIERVQTFKALQQSNSDALALLEKSNAGFDFYEVTNTALSALDGVKIAIEVKDQIKALPVHRRKALVGLLNEIIEDEKREDAS